MTGVQTCALPIYDLELAAQITARFGGGKAAEQVDIEATFIDGTTEALTVNPISPTQMDPTWYI